MGEMVEAFMYWQSVTLLDRPTDLHSNIQLFSPVSDT